MKPTEVTINRPLYGTFVYVRDKYLKEAMKNKTDIIIKSGEYQCQVNPKLWIKEGKTMLKEFLIPGKPMKLHGNDILRYI